MHAALVSHLAFEDGNAGEFQLDVYRADPDGQVIDGLLTAPEGDWYPVIDGVPCLLRGDLRPDFRAFAAHHGLVAGQAGASGEAAREQGRTNVTFNAKWEEIPNYAIADSERAFVLDWYVKKLGVDSLQALEQFYAGKQRILEVGPGSGFNVRYMSEHSSGLVFALDISTGAKATFDNNRDCEHCHVVQGDLMDTPFPDGYFDFIMADGVLHHTPDTRAAVRALYAKLTPGGQFFFYVYRKMGAARQFADAHIRKAFKNLTPEACIAACEPLTELGRELSRLNASITLDKPIEVLGIPAGTHDVQRLFYYNFVKCFWNEAFDYKLNNMVNYDWYHPHSAFQHSEEEVRGWLDELGVTEYQINDANPNGISVLLEKQSA